MNHLGRYVMAPDESFLLLGQRAEHTDVYMLDRVGPEGRTAVLSLQHLSCIHLSSFFRVHPHYELNQGYIQSQNV